MNHHEDCRLNFSTDMIVSIRGIRNNFGNPYIFDTLATLETGQDKIKIDCSNISDCNDNSFGVGTSLLL